MIAELIPAWTADAIHFRMLKEILCGNQLPKIKAGYSSGHAGPGILLSEV
jgi:hypothetical protein